MIAIASAKPKKIINPGLALLPADPDEARLTEVFSCRYSTILADLPTGDNSPAWTTQKYPMRPRTLAEHWRDPYTLVGVRFDSTTSYGLLDIDKGSKYLNEEAIANIRTALEQVGIVRTILLRSSVNGGAHLYIPLPGQFKTYRVAQVLQGCLIRAGFDITKGTLELRPNVKKWDTLFEAHRLPLQYGSCILNDDLNPEHTSLARFWAIWDMAASHQDTDALNEAMGAYGSIKPNWKGSGKADKWKADLLTIIDEGWTGDAQTNDLLGVIATYCRVFEGWGGMPLADAIASKAQNLPGYTEYCNHHADIHKRSIDWARCAEKQYTVIGFGHVRSGDPLPPAGPNNEQRALSAIERIKMAVNHIEQTENVPQTVRNWVQAITQYGVSAQTLYKNKSLWHPEHRQVCVTGDYEGVSAITIDHPVEQTQQEQAVTHPPYKKRMSCEVTLDGSEISSLPSSKSINSSIHAPAAPSAKVLPILEIVESSGLETEPYLQVPEIQTSEIQVPSIRVLASTTSLTEPEAIQVTGVELERVGILGYSLQHKWVIRKDSYSTTKWIQLRLLYFVKAAIEQLQQDEQFPNTLAMWADAIYHYLDGCDIQITLAQLLEFKWLWEAIVHPA